MEFFLGKIFGKVRRTHVVVENSLIIVLLGNRCLPRMGVSVDYRGIALIPAGNIWLTGERSVFARVSKHMGHTVQGSGGILEFSAFKSHFCHGMNVHQGTRLEVFPGKLRLLLLTVID